MEKGKPSSSKKRIAQPPDLIGGQLRPKNAAWLSKQQQKERDYKRRAAAERYERESKDGSNRRAYGVASESILAQEVNIEPIGADTGARTEQVAVLIGGASLVETQEGDL